MLCMTGLYKCQPNRKYRGQLYWDNMFHCCNWTFTINEYSNGKIYMRDTYWSSGSDGVVIELTDDNFKEFELIFDFNDVKSHSGNNIRDYEECDWWHVAVDSGGMSCGGKYFVKKDALKNKENVLRRLEYEIESLERSLQYKKQNYENVKAGVIKLEWA